MAGRAFFASTLLVVLGGLTPAGAGAATLDEVLALHTRSRGGLERWQAVRSLAVSGTQVSFSEPSPFSLLKVRPGKLRWEYDAMGSTVVTAFDGEGGWWINPVIAGWPTKLPTTDRDILRREAAIEPPLLLAPERGDSLELVAEEDLDGTPVYTVKLKPREGEEETFYLDRVTGLEVARLSPGSDFGQAMPMWTYYSDFRPVQGLVIPHHVEMEYGIRHVMQDLEKVELDGAVAEGVFVMPLSEGMAPLRTLAGEWNVEIETRAHPRAPWDKSNTTATITPRLDGNLLEERLSWVNQGIPVSIVRTRSWDRFRKLHRMTEIDDFTSHLNLFEGTLVDGRLTLSNEKAGTPAELYGQTIHDRVTISEITPDRFAVLAETTTDGGTTWVESVKSVYTRRAE